MGVMCSQYSSTVAIMGEEAVTIGLLSVELVMELWWQGVSSKIKSFFYVLNSHDARAEDIA